MLASLDTPGIARRKKKTLEELHSSLEELHSFHHVLFEQHKRSTPSNYSKRPVSVDRNQGIVSQETMLL